VNRPDLLLNKILEERLSKKSSEPLLADLFPLQQQILKDKSPRKALLFGRRFGKSTVAVYALILTALAHAGSLSLFISPSKSQSKANIWSLLVSTCETHRLGHETNGTELTVTFPNGSVIRVDGCHTASDAEHFRGQKYRLVIIDEAGAFGDHLSYLITEVISPAQADFDPSSTAIWLVGTPNITCTGLFHDVTNTDQYPGWKQWHGTLADNPYLPRWRDIPNYEDLGLVEKLFDEICLKDGLDRHSPSFIREYLATWIRDDSSLVIPSPIQTFSELPDKKWNWVIGVDDGTVDAHAAALCAWSPDDPCFYVVDTYEQSQLTTDEKRDKLVKWWKKHPNALITVDPGAAGKQFILDTMKATGIPMSAAKKRSEGKGRAQFIEHLTDSIRREIVLVHSDLWSTLEQLKNLVWTDKAAGKMAGRDHIFDAIRYAHMASGHFYYKEKKPEESPRSDIKRVRERIRDENYYKNIMFGGSSNGR
jgi:hypothetical protein